jgi:DNA-binding SARP family transcriptional activator
MKMFDRPPLPQLELVQKPDIRIQLLARPRITCERTETEIVLPPQTLLVFAMLVLSKGEVLSREDIAFTLWPDESESDALGTLRRHIYRLQQALPACVRSFLVCDARTACWKDGRCTYVDVCEFVRLSDSFESLERAAKVYAGDFLPRVDHEWATTIREHLRRRACRVLERLIAQYRSSGDKYSALEYVEELLELDPWREDALRDLMMLRFAVGDRAGALAYYRTFQQRLRCEFEVDPMPETVQCLDMIARGQSA